MIDGRQLDIFPAPPVAVAAVVCKKCRRHLGEVIDDGDRYMCAPCWNGLSDEGRHWFICVDVADIPLTPQV